jgi:UDP-N-acetylmuramyl pentapeptide phosphotransferase/UDP-N-acetylglucosamine-1-phosphate transferase
VSRAGRAAAGGTTVAGTVVTGAAGAAAARAAYRTLRQHPPAGQQTWTRTNHRGELVTLLEGPAVAVGAITAEVVGAAVAARLSGRPGEGQRQSSPERTVGSHASLAMAVAGGGALGFGVLDDLAGSGNRRGLKGHLGALAHGEVTTGSVKLAGLAATGLAGGLLLGGRRSDVLVNAALIAGGANLLNLFDLRPGRAVKVAALSAGLIAAGGAGGPDRSAGLAAVAAPLGAGLALLPEDLAERAMLGDAGANALGAMLGAAAAGSLPRPARVGLLAGIVALTVASEKVSFTKVIERTPTLRRLDMLGRRPAPPTAPVATAAATVPATEDDPPDAAQVIRLQGRRAGRHRRVGTGEDRVRSINWLFGLFFRALARQEQ